MLNPFVLTIRQGKSGIEIASVRNGKQKDAYAPSELLGEDPEEAEVPPNGNTASVSIEHECRLTLG